MWSQKYRIFHELIQVEMKEHELNLQPIFIEQSVFDKELYQTENAHSWNGCTIKVDLLLERLRTSSAPYILFTDVDLIIKPGVYTTIQPYIEQEQTMVFIKEGESGVNIGFILLKVCNEVINFWENVKNKMLEIPGHDQKYVNELLSLYSGKWTTFDPQIMTLSNMWNRTTPFVVLQLLSSCLGKEYDFAEKIFNAAQYAEIEKYMEYVPEDIIPYIYKIQEIIIRSHQQAKQSALNS